MAFGALLRGAERWDASGCLRVGLRHGPFEMGAGTSVEGTCWAPTCPPACTPGPSWLPPVCDGSRVSWPPGHPWSPRRVPRRLYVGRGLYSPASARETSITKGSGRRVEEGEKGLSFKNVQDQFSSVPSFSSIVVALYFLRGIYCANV